LIPKSAIAIGGLAIPLRLGALGERERGDDVVALQIRGIGEDLLMAAPAIEQVQDQPDG
jgi:hypothetical protein